uniref:Disintegrin domain-containing protein n=1 Tax=Rhabditophanes sp. KR3021 TaxID=114890 RepID=A0AC35TH23_9BILA
MPTGNPGNNGNPAKLGQACPGNTKCLDKTVCSTAKFCVEPCTKDSDCGAFAPTGSCVVVAGGTDKACTNHNTHNACTPGDPPKCGIGNRCNKFTMNCESGKNLGQECDTTDDCLLRLVCNPTITDGSKSVCTAACSSNSECTLPNGTTKRCSQTSASPTALATGYCEINKKMECHKNNQCSKRCNTHILQCNN